MPARGLPHGSSSRRHAPLSGARWGQAVPGGRLLQGSRQSCRQCVLHALPPARAARRCAGRCIATAWRGPGAPSHGWDQGVGARTLTGGGGWRVRGSPQASNRSNVQDVYNREPVPCEDELNQRHRTTAPALSLRHCTTIGCSLGSQYLRLEVSRQCLRHCASPRGDTCILPWPHRLPRDSHFSGHEAGLPHGVGGACACVAQDHIAAWTPWNCPMPRCVHQQSHPRRVDPDSIHPDRSATGAVWYIDLRHGMLTRLCCEVTRGIHVAWTG